MKLFIRAHDLGVKGENNIIKRLDELGLSGVQLVAYKCLDGVAYAPGAITAERAAAFGSAFKSAGKTVPLIGAYFNPVHPNEEKIRLGKAVFKDYLDRCHEFSCNVVGSETGSYNGDKWIYHPQNRTAEALDRVINVFSELADYAKSSNAFIGMEGAFGHVCWNVKTLDKAVRAVGRDNIKIIFDLYNYLDISNVNEMYDILREGLETFGDNIRVFHIKDCIITDSGALKQVGVGRGIFDYSRIIPEIGKICPDASLVLEGTVGDDIPYAVSHIRQFI